MFTGQHSEQQAMMLTTTLRNARPGDECCEMVLLSSQLYIDQHIISSSVKKINNFGVPWSCLFGYTYVKLSGVAASLCSGDNMVF